MKFLDQARVFIRSGAGGAGCLSFRREKNVEFGGPDGGNGGRGGDVIAECVDGLNTLVDFRYQQHFRGATGGHGMGRNRTGADGRPALLRVPAGTQILDNETGELIVELVEVGQRRVLARGGDGGRGNASFRTSTNQAPRKTIPGWPGEEMEILLRLRLAADAGLVGLPNAGKSTFLAAVSRARPKIADYPFTTLHPQLGTVAAGEGEFVLADIPGLIEGAHEGRGLGDRFLGHVERCGVLLHLVDGTGADPAAAWREIRTEMDAYGAGLADKPEIVALTKCDALTPAEAEKAAAALADATGAPVSRISAVSGEGMPEIIGALWQHILVFRKQQATAAAPAAPAEGWRP